jgi:hypothetical protein
MKTVVLGLRIDPCSNVHVGDGESCIRQLRLIAESPELGDRSVHLIYNFSEDVFKNLVSEVSALNDQCHLVTKSTPLAVHPCSAEDEFLSRFNQILFKYSRDEYLQKVAFQIPTADNRFGVFWVFAAIEKQNNGSWELIKTPSAPQGEEFFAFGSGPGFFNRMVLDETDRQVVSGLRNQLDENEAFELISSLEDTKSRRVDNTSCMSCHAVQSLRSRNDKFKLDNWDYFNISEFERQSSHSPGRADIRHFGYRFGQPKISTRVHLESAEAVSYLNKD